MRLKEREIDWDKQVKRRVMPKFGKDCIAFAYLCSQKVSMLFEREMLIEINAKVFDV